MKPKEIMFIAGEASGDMLAAELVHALREELTSAEVSYTWDLQPLQTGLEPRFFGAGGPRMKEAGVELAFDMTEHSVIGPSDILRHYPKFRRIFESLLNLAVERQPDAIICVDFGTFNGRFAHAIRQYISSRSDWFHDWRPKIVQYVSPQVWASREGRAYRIARDFDLVLTLFDFEKKWYEERVPRLQVEFVGHPIVERYYNLTTKDRTMESSSSRPLLLLLPGSRVGELKRHLPVMLGALKLIRAKILGLRARMILPSESLTRRAKSYGVPSDLEVQTGGLAEALSQADAAIASTGTVTMECAYFGVPTVTLYKTFWLTFAIAKRIAKVKWATMPNLLRNEEIFPEFLQGDATPENISRATLDLLQNGGRREQIQKKLAEVIVSLGKPGSSRRAARAIVSLLEGSKSEVKDKVIFDF